MLEVIGLDIENCLLAQAAGAGRIELCDNFPEGGTTPSYGLIKGAREALQIGLYPMIRPRGGDFLYTDAEFNIMKTDIRLCKDLGCDGVVFGLLNADGSIDQKRTARLVEWAYPMDVTFHRAFDRCRDPFEALEQLIASGCERILTSGQQKTALEGAALIHELVKQADDRICIMPGSGVNSSNILELKQKTGARAFHTSARLWKKSNMHFVSGSMQEELRSLSVDIAEIKALVEKLSASGSQANA